MIAPSRRPSPMVAIAAAAALLTAAGGSRFTFHPVQHADTPVAAVPQG